MSRTLLQMAGGPAYSPLGSSKLIETWLSYAGTTDDGAGLTSAWAGQRRGHIFTAAGALRPTLTAAQFAALAGLVFSSNRMACATIGADITGNTGLTVLMAMFAPGNVNSVVIEYSNTWFTNAGTFAISKVTDNTVGAGARVTANGVANVLTNACPLVVPGVLSADFDFTKATLEASVRLDNVALPFTQTEANNAGTMGNFSLFLGGRNTGTPLYTPLTCGAVAIYQTLTAAELTIEARGLGAIFGGIVVA